MLDILVLDRHTEHVYAKQQGQAPATILQTAEQRYNIITMSGSTVYAALS
jgi:hypothetical protein